MKKAIVVLLVSILAVFSASAQKAVKATGKTTAAPAVETAVPTGTINPQDLNYIGLLNKQNKLLNQRKIATIIGASGLGTFMVGYFLAISDNHPVRDAGIIVTYAGIATTLTGAIWGLTNEFQLISNQKKINENLILRMNPNGIVLQF